MSTAINNAHVNMTQRISMPQNGQTIKYQIQAGQMVELNFNTDYAVFERRGTSLLIKTTDGESRLDAFFDLETTNQLPAIVLQDGTIIPGEKFLRAHSPEMYIATPLELGNLEPANSSEHTSIPKLIIDCRLSDLQSLKQPFYFNESTPAMHGSKGRYGQIVLDKETGSCRYELDYTSLMEPMQAHAAKYAPAMEEAQREHDILAARMYDLYAKRDALWQRLDPIASKVNTAFDTGDMEKAVALLEESENLQREIFNGQELKNLQNEIDILFARQTYLESYIEGLQQVMDNGPVLDDTITYKDHNGERCHLYVQLGGSTRGYNCGFF